MDQCRRRTLATGDFAVVEQCSCGSVHVTIGAVTLRLHPSALPSLALTIGDAARAVTFENALGARSLGQVLS